MAQPVLVAGARTPIGKMLGSLSGPTAPELGGTAVRAALERAGITGDQVDAVILGNVVQAGLGPNPARLAAVAGGIPMSAPATTVNKLCLSGLTAIAEAAQQITVGQYEVVVAGGMESMSNAPYLLPRAGRAFRYGDTPLLDALDQDALVCGFDGIPMGVATERYQAGLGISREDPPSPDQTPRCCTSRPTRSGTPCAATAPWASATWTCSKSTRPSPGSPSPPCVTSGCPRTG